MVWMAAALAAPPTRLVDGFDATGSWFPARSTSAPDGRAALALAPGDPAAAVTPVVVTHKTARLAVFSADLWPVRLTAALDDGRSSLVLPVARWTEVTIDTSALCGRSAAVSLAVEPVHPALAGPGDPVYVDRIEMTGEIYQFRDLDEDARCAQGYDRDGDGWCVGADEPTEPGPPVDCNDTSPGPRCLLLAVDDRDRTTTLTAEGAGPDEEVWFFGSTARGQTCPPALGAVCMDLALPRRVGVARADDRGIATLRVPRTPGRWFQASVLRIGRETDVSPVARADGPVVAPDPIQDR